MSFIDIHAHFDMLENSPEIVLQKAKIAGISKIITIGTEPSDHQYVLDVARQYYPEVFCTLGVHPHQSKNWTDEVRLFIEKHLKDREVVAVGEIGLDYYYNQSPVDKQQQAFREQLDIAARCKMPVQIHTRDAEQDTVEILSEYKGKVSGVIHCFTGTEWLARQCLDLGYNISFSGIITFKSADSLRQICKLIPLNRIHIETDAPFLSPVPMRGKKNTPAFLVHTAQAVAQLKEISIETLSQATNENTLKIFSKMKFSY